MAKRRVRAVPASAGLVLLFGSLTACTESSPVSVAPGGGAPGSPVVAPAEPPVSGPVTQRGLYFTASDGEQLYVDLRGTDDLAPKPLIVEFSPYGSNSALPDFGAGYNYAFVHARGTGQSTGAWGAVGPDDQRDIAEFLGWACEQPWSNGRIGLYGFSASAIAIYNSMHLALPCVEAAVLMAGTADLYRDLLYPGGIPNLVPGVVVALGVGAPLIASTPPRMTNGQAPTEPLLSGLGLLGLTVDVLRQQVENDYWLARTQRPGPNRFPVLANTGFYDVESRGPFESYRLLRDQGVPVHLRVLGAHDGYPADTPGPFPEYRRWFERYLLDVDNGIDRESQVQLLVGHGGYPALMGGAWSRAEADDWPVPGTRWQALYLDPSRGGGALSLNDGQLSPTPVTVQARQAYLAATSLGTASDPNTTSTIWGAMGSWFEALPMLAQMNLMEPLALTYSTPPLMRDIDVVGPAGLTLHLSSLLPQTDLYAVIADVGPDGRSHAVGIGRLRTSFPDVILERSRIDEHGEIVQPYADFSAKTPTLPTQTREYHVEFWPLGNRFQAGHRVRLYLVGAPTFALPAPSLNVISVGGDTPSRLLLPLLPGSDFCAAIGASC